MEGPQGAPGPQGFDRQPVRKIRNRGLGRPRLMGLGLLCGEAGSLWTLRGLTTFLIASPIAVLGATPPRAMSVLISAAIVVLVHGRYRATVW
jgi:hypothetical protein